MEFSEYEVIHMGGKIDGTLKEKRVVLGLTQQQVADKARISLRAYQKFESGDRNIRTASFQVACRVIEALGMDVSKFYHDEYVFGEKRYLDSEGWKYQRTGKLVTDDVEDDRKTLENRVEIIPARPARIISASEFTGMIAKVPAGKVVRIEDICRYFEEKYQIERAEPDYSGWPVYDRDGNEIPYWRVIGLRGTVTGARYCDLERQNKLLTQEGIVLVPYKKSYRIIDYKKYLYSFSPEEKP